VPVHDWGTQEWPEPARLHASNPAGHLALLPLSPAHKGIVSAYKTQQHHIVHRGRSFHFVSYEGQDADLKRQQAETPPSWYLMLAGKRWMVMPELAPTVPEELDRQFTEWLDARVFTGAPAVQSQQPPSPGAATLAGPAEALRSAVRSASARL